MAERILDPSGNLYKSFMKIINAITIKYFYKARKYETLETQIKADEYLDAINKKDTFFSYSDYTNTDFKNVGITDKQLIARYRDGNREVIPKKYRDELLSARRQRVIDNFEEKNNYYRMLNGMPDVDDTQCFYVSSSLAKEFNIDQNIPIHLIQDHYNKIDDGEGDYLISIVEGSGYIDKLIAENPDKKYLKYLGTKRIDLYTARSAKNFQIIQVRKTSVTQAILDTFIRVYEQCREYFVKTIYISTYAEFLDFYDNFIAMSIMIMTLQQVAPKQISLGIKREYFDINAVRALYEAYDVPFNLTIDEDTQTDIVQNLNLLIQNKATDKVIYNIANLLGFTNVNLYKYYLTKEHIMDKYDVPIFKYTERFNTDTAQMEVVPDYNGMYDLYFQKFKLNEKNFVNSFNDKSNRVEYKEVISKDPYWHEDQHVWERVWESEYNFVESKYLSLGISYSMTEIMFENVILLKLILHDDLVGFKHLSINLPKIVEDTDFPLFDVIILMMCLLSIKHNIYGEIITVPTQVISVVDYINNTDRGGAHHDTFTFDFNYFFNPNSNEDKTKMEKMKNDLIDHMNNPDKSKTTSDAISFNFEYFSPKNNERSKHIAEMKKILGEDDYQKFLTYVEKLSPRTVLSNYDRIQTLNDMFASIKGLYRLINFYMTKTDNHETYESLKRIYYSLFVSKEMSDIFTVRKVVTNPDTGEEFIFERTAWTYFEYLYHKNPKLYHALFQYNIEDEYDVYMEAHPDETMTLFDFTMKVAKGEIFINFGKLKTADADESVQYEVVYSSINHIISRLEMVLNDVKFMYVMNDSSTPLEILLMQLVRFFKSYTVDILDLDILYVCDFKPENLIKLIGKIAYMEKTIGINMDLPISYSDTIGKITNIIYPNDQNLLHDITQYNAFMDCEDGCKMKDGIHKMWYTH